MVADRHSHAAYHNKHWWRASYECQHRWPWMTLNSKNIDFKWFFGDFGCKRVNCDEMDEDGLGLPANRNCYRLLHISWPLAQISCFPLVVQLVDDRICCSHHPHCYILASNEKYSYRRSCFRSQIAFVVTAQWHNHENFRWCRVGSHQLLYAAARWSNNKLQHRRLLIPVDCMPVFPGRCLQQLNDTQLCQLLMQLSRYCSCYHCMTRQICQCH